MSKEEYDKHESISRMVIAHVLDGYTWKDQDFTQPQAFDNAKAELIGTLQRDIAIIETMDFQEFIHYKEMGFEDNED